MSKVILSSVVAMLIAIVVVISTHKVPFDESMYPGVDTAKNFGSCVAYMQYVHENYSDIMDPATKGHNALTKDIVSLYYQYVKESHPMAMDEIVNGYSEGLALMNSLSEDTGYQALFETARVLCQMTLIDSHTWAIDNVPFEVRSLMEKHNVTYQGHDMFPVETEEYNLEDAI